MRFHINIKDKRNYNISLKKICLDNSANCYLTDKDNSGSWYTILCKDYDIFSNIINALKKKHLSMSKIIISSFIGVY